MLYHIKHHSIPKLGAMFVDMDSLLDALQINNGEMISAFSMQVIKIETSLDGSGVTISTNRFTKKSIGILTHHNNIVPFMSDCMCRFAQFAWLHPNKQFEKSSATAIITTLTGNEMSLDVQLFIPTCSIKPSLSTQSRHFDHRSSQGGNDSRFISQL